MNFAALVRRARDLHVQGKVASCSEELEDEVYGRICTSENDQPPEKLTTTRGRKTAFVFGPDAIISVILKMKAYDAVLELGFTRAYVYHELVEKKSTYWLLLFKPSAYPKVNNRGPLFVPATWDGVTQLVHSLYPEVYPDMVQNLQTLKETPFEEFEREAGFEFLESIKNEKGSLPNGAPFYSYQRYCSLPSPRSAWQVRLFLYCEMRLLKRFRGDGYAEMRDGRAGCLEYLCPNIHISALDSQHSALIPMSVSIPNDDSSTVEPV